MAAISVVIPVYNVQDYLAQSVRSVREQSLSDIEIILVNDGSTDDSGRIAAELASVDSRIVLVNKPNGGLSSARNAGIKAAASEYVCFLDSDDLMEPEACSVIVSAFERTGADVVTYGANLYPEFVDSPWTVRVLSPRDVEYLRFDSALLFKEAATPFAWRTACRLEQLRRSGLLFDETLPFGEDQVFLFQLYPRLEHVSLISNKLVKYRMARPGSLMDTHVYDAVRLARAHVDIAERIVMDWHHLGLVEGRETEILDWLAEFSILRAMQLDEGERNVVLDSLKRVLTAYFPEADLVKYANEDLAGDFIKAIMLDESYRRGNKRRLAVYKHFLKTEGKKSVLRRIFGAVGSAPIFSPMVRLKNAISGKTRKGADIELRRKVWESKDLEDRTAAAAALERELKEASTSYSVDGATILG